MDQQFPPTNPPSQPMPIPQHSTPQQPLPQQSQLPNSSSQPPQHVPLKSTKGISSVLTTLLGVIFGLILLIIVFGLLNYFNILRLESVFPQLSFLPHVSSYIQATPTPTFTYNVTGDDQALEKYTKNVLADIFLPKSASVSADPFIFVQNKNIFTSFWNIPIPATTSASLGASANLFVIEQTDIPDVYHIKIQSYVPPLAQYSLEMKPVDIAKQTSLKVFRADLSRSLWQCSNNFPVVCTTQTKTTEGIYEYTVSIQQNFQSSSSAVLSVSSCFVPKNSPSFNTQSACGLSE